MTNMMRTMAMLAAMLGTAVAPQAVRADDDDGDSAPRTDDAGPAQLFSANGLAEVPYTFTSPSGYPKGTVTVTARLSVPDDADCKATPTAFTITIDSAGGASKIRKVAMGAVGKLAAPVSGVVKVTIDVEVAPGCDLMLETVGAYAP